MVGSDIWREQHYTMYWRALGDLVEGRGKAFLQASYKNQCNG